MWGFLCPVVLQGKKGYGYNSYTSSENITYCASKCIIPNLATIADNSAEMV